MTYNSNCDDNYVKIYRLTPALISIICSIIYRISFKTLKRFQSIYKVNNTNLKKL